MNFKRQLAAFFIAVTIGTLASPVQAQGTFQNLDFEEGTFVPVPNDPAGSVYWDSAMPGWTGYVGGQQLVSVLPNGVPIGPPGQTPFVAIMVPPLWNAPQGSYEVGFGAAQDDSGGFIPVALAQAGQVPSRAMSLQFLALYAPTVFLGGQQLAIVRLGSGPSTRSLFGADISDFAGQTLDLRFETGLGINFLDDIQFSPEAIPEPGVISLLSFGALLLGWRKVARRK